MAGIKINDLPALGRDLASTDLFEMSLAGGTGSRKITGQEIINGIPLPPSGITIGTTAITSGTVGRVLFEGTGNVVSESGNFTWDNPNQSLFIGGQISFGGNTDQIKASSNSGNFDFLSNLPMRFLRKTGPVELMRIVSSTGNVLINTTTDAGYKLDVNGTARVVGQATIQTLTIGLGASSVANNTALGFQALNANTTGSGNTATGYQSMLANTTGVNNAAFGISAMSGSTTGNDNAALGYNALAGANTGSSNTAIGNRSLIVNTSGSYNTAVGRSALNSNTTGQFNTAVGYFALRLNVVGQNNVAVGDNALSSSTGDVNTAVGTGALSATTTGQFNTAIGASSLNANTTGSGNTAVGYSTQTGNFNNSVILGWGATATASNQFVIGTAARNAGAVVTQVNASTKYWEVVINGVTQKVLLA